MVARVVLMWPIVFSKLYSLLGWFALPWLWMHPKARRHMSSLPAPSPGCIWVHGASAGEHQAARALCSALSSPYWRTYSSWRTPIPDAFPAPLDLPVVRDRWLDRARPQMLILVEAELWPGWIQACRQRNIPIAVVNARQSRSTNRWKRLGLWKWLTHGLTVIPIEDIGDLKTAAPTVASPFHVDRPYLLGASTHPADETALLAAWETLPNRPLLILAPRRVDRTNTLLKHLSKHSVQLRSQMPLKSTTEILILDTYGELAGLYANAQAALIGGTFDEQVGGHSPAEAISNGCAYVYGPHTSRNTDSFAHGEGILVESPAHLTEALQRAILATAQPLRADPEQAVARLPEGQTPTERPARPWLKPFAPLWVKWGSRQPSYSAPPDSAPIPIISVGGLSAGGTGKTPICAWLAEQADGLWISSRGYRRPKDGPVLRVLDGLGDEAEMLKRRGLKVISCPDRFLAAHYAAEQGAKGLIIDDGFQHRRLNRQLNICSINMHWPTSRGQIPVGWAREDWSAHERAHILWLHQYDSSLPCPPLSNRPKVRSQLIPSHWWHRGQSYPLSHLQGAFAVAVGIAHPEAFLTALHQLNIAIDHLFQFPDHHPLPELPTGCIVTEKDAARLPPDADVWALCMSLQVDNPNFVIDQLELCLSPLAF